MNIKETYETLYEHWLKEFNQSELSSLNQEKFNQYNNLVDEVLKLEKNLDVTIKNQLLKVYQDNYSFIFQDLLKIREIKILNAALVLKQIKLDNLYEAEKLFYQNLVSALKGFEKIKRLSTLEDSIDMTIIPESETERIEPVSEEKVQGTIQDQPPQYLDLGPLKDVKDDEYALIRFVKRCPALVGVDLLNYGPFNEEDIAFLPAKNAKILISEKFAEVITIT